MNSLKLNDLEVDDLELEDVQLEVFELNVGSLPQRPMYPSEASHPWKGDSKYSGNLR